MENCNYDAALPLWAETLEWKHREMGDCVNTLSSMGVLATLHYVMGRLDLALPLLRDALQRSRRGLGDRHPTSQGLAAAAAQVLASQEEDEGEQQEDETIHKRRRRA